MRFAELLVLAGVLGACTPYTPGTIADTLALSSESVRVVGCLDVAVASHGDAAAEGPAVKIAFGNHCRVPTVVDLGAVTATLVYRGGRSVAMGVYDPRAALRPAVLDARTQGAEVLEYHPRGGPEHGQVAESLCLDLSRMDSKHPVMQPVYACVAVDFVWMPAGAPQEDDQ